MTIENRILAPGTKLVGAYKKTTFTCEVVSTPEGEVRFQLEDGRLFTSPSSAGKAVMNGISCNGWRFWSLAEEGGATARPVSPAEPAITTATMVAATPKPAAKRVRQIKKLPNQKGAPEGETRWFCSGCMKGFLMPTGQEPPACPEGHPCEVEDAFASTD
jgi:Restriction Enzyme Adenine Methylase Associated